MGLTMFALALGFANSMTFDSGMPSTSLCMMVAWPTPLMVQSIFMTCFTVPNCSSISGRVMVTGLSQSPSMEPVQFS